MVVQTLDLWELVRGKPQIDPTDLAEAVNQQTVEPELDYRTRLLIRDSMDALRLYWGENRFERWLASCPQRDRLESIHRENFEKVGFPTIRKRLMDKTKPDDVRQYLEEIGQTLREETTIYIAGSVALLLPGYLSRHTDDIDVIDEVPTDIRNKPALLDQLADRYGLQLGHVQSHYFPAGWQQRVHSIGPFGRLRVYLLDVHDVFLSKLFSLRPKDRDDLRLLMPQLDKDVLVRKLKETTGDFLAVPDLRQMAQDNWQILFGEPLPT